MARPERIRLEVPANVGVGAPIHVLALRDKTMQLSGPFVGAVLVEGTASSPSSTSTRATPTTGSPTRW